MIDQKAIKQATVSRRPLSRGVITQITWSSASSDLDERHSQRVSLYLPLDGIAHAADELVRDDEHQDVGVAGGLHQVRDRHLTGGVGKGGVKGLNISQNSHLSFLTLASRTRGKSKTHATHDIGRQLVSGEVLDVLVVDVYYLRQFSAVHHLLEHPHVHRVVKLGIPGSIAPHDLGDGRAPLRQDEIELY